MEKLKRQAGESLVELLLSMLIISLGMLMLAGAITTTARLNAKARDMSMRTVSEPTPGSQQPNIQLELGGRVLADAQVTIIQSDNNTELYFYG